MDPITTTATDPISRPKPNGILTRKQQHHHPIIRHHHPPPPPSLYRECLKNHAASLGGHALDGCCEFMPSPSSNPSDPSSLTCAACGCHRNFHRRALLYDDDGGAEDSGGGGASSRNDDTDGGGGGLVDRRHLSTSPPPPSAPHMLLALSTGGGLSPAAAAGPAAGGATTPTPTPTATASVGVGGINVPRKRFRSKFSPEQKDRMQELSERLGWRMQKRGEGIIEETCREIGVGKGVFKVWMHNNKHNFLLNNNNNSSSSANASASAGLGLGGESHVRVHHHNNGVNGPAVDHSSS